MLTIFQTIQVPPPPRLSEMIADMNMNNKFVNEKKLWWMGVDRCTYQIYASNIVYAPFSVSFPAERRR